MVHHLFRRMVRAAAKRRRNRSALDALGLPAHRHDAGLAQAAQALRPAMLESLESRLLMSIAPTASEQFMLELVNRMRMDPAGELARLTSSLGSPARSSDPDIDAALVFFGVHGPTLAAQWSALSAVAPLAWNEALIDVAEAHNNAMIAGDVQSHEAPGEPSIASGGLRTRFNNQGYSDQSFIGENIFAFADTVFQGHAALAIDWGGSGATGGIQSPPGHRESIMNANFREVGIRITPEGNGATDVGPLVITQNFGGVVDPQPLPYLLGVAYDDTDSDGFYGIGEGLGGVNVNILGINGTGGEFNTTTMTAGGYQLAVPQGTYRVTFSGGGLASPLVQDEVVVGSDNVKVDTEAAVVLLVDEPEIDLKGNGVSIVDGDVTPAGADHTSFGGTNITGGTVTRTFTIDNLGAAGLNLSGSPLVQIGGANAADFTVTVAPQSSISAGGSTTFNVTFDPSATGQRDATISIMSDDGDEALYNFAVSGTGTNPEIDIQGNATSITDADVTPRTQDFTDFRQVPLTGALTSVTRTFTIRNTGSTALSLTGSPRVTISGAHASDFTVTTQPASASVAASSNTTFVITFNPSAAGLRTATVTITSDDADEASYDFAIQGTGISTSNSGNGLQSATLVAGTGSGATSGQGISMIYTGYLTTGTQFDSNVGGNPFNLRLGANSVIQGWEQGLLGIKVGETRTLVIPPALGYGNNPPSGSSIPPGATLIFEVQRIAGDIALGSPQATVVPIADGDATPSTADHTDMGPVTLGDGQADFDGQGNPVGVPDGAAQWTFRITATGAINLTGSSPVTIGGADASAFSIVQQPASPILAGSGSTTGFRDFVVTFNPKRLGLHTAFIAVASDDPDEDPYTFSIAGTGIANRISGAVEDTAFVVTHAMLNDAMRESGTSGYIIDSVESGQLFKDGVAVVPGVTTVTNGQSLVWLPGANANRTLDAFTVKVFDGGVAVGAAEQIRIEVTPAEDSPVGAISDVALGASADQEINLAALFSDADITGTVARIVTSLGAIDVHLFNGLTPLTVANFLKYASEGDYANTLIHRVVPAFVVQGGGYRPQLPASHIATDAAVANEPGVAALRGTIAMAKTGNQVNSATSEWFFNLDDNAANLGNQNGGFTVFGEVVGSGMSVVDDIASTPLYTDGQTLTNLPLRNYSGGAVQDANWIKTISVGTVSNLSFSVVGNTNEDLVTPTITGGTLDLDMAAGVSGSSDITIRTTDLTGRSVDVTFTVSVTGVSIEAIDGQAAEPADGAAANVARFRITRTGSTTDDLGVGYTIGGTAQNGVDYDSIPVFAVIPAGATFVDVVITPLEDGGTEGTETVTLTITPAAGFTVTDGEADATISDDKAIVAVEAIDAAAAEPGNPGVFEFTRTGATTSPLTVHYTVGGTATNGTDYTLIAQTVVIPVGQSSVTVNIATLDDALGETQETVVLELAADDAYGIDDVAAEATVTIADDEAVTVQIVTIDGSVSEGAPANPGLFRITRTGPVTSPLNINIVRGGSATFGAAGDYTLAIDGGNFITTVVTIEAGESSVDIDVNAINDLVPDAGETVFISLAGGAGYALAANPALQSAGMIITDNEPVVSIASLGFTGADAAAAETDNGETSNRATFRISRTGSTTQAMTVRFTAGGTAARTGSKADYVFTSGGQTLTNFVVTIPAGLAHVDLFVDPINDQLVEATESVIVALAADPSQYSLSPTASEQVAQVTIADNEPVISVAVAGFTGADAAGAETNTGETGNSARFRVSRTSAGPALTVPIKIKGTAKNKKDYVLTVNGQVFTGSKLVIPNNALFVDIIVNVINDSSPEVLENITLSLTKASKSFSLDPDPAKRMGVVTIADNEPTVALTVTDAAAAEPGGDGNTGRFRITRTGSTTQPLDVKIKVNGTAKGGKDYVAMPKVVTIPAGAAFLDIDVQPLTDASVEAPEAVTMTLSKSKTFTVDPAASVGSVIIADGVAAPGPDLVMLSVVNKGKAFDLGLANSPLAIKGTLKNQGDTASVASQLRVYFSKDRQFDVNDLFMGAFTIAPIAPGKTVKVAGGFGIAGTGVTTTHVGQYYVLLVADFTNAVSEPIESNNALAGNAANVIIHL